MPLVPAFILRRLYVKGSLKNAHDGWQFTLRNSLDSGYAIGLVPIELDDEHTISMSKTWFDNDGITVTFDVVTENNTFGLKMNNEIEKNVIGDQLIAGEHTIYFGCIIPGIGKIGFDFTDNVHPSNG